MSEFVAALPMYDWPEVRAEVDAEWAAIRDRLRAAGIDAPERLARRNADLPPVPGGIRGPDGVVIAPDPATLPPDAFDLPTLWRHPMLLLSQTCWGPMNATDLWTRVAVVGQPDYSGVPGGCDATYSSAIVARMPLAGGDRPPPADGRADLPLDRIAGGRLAFNDANSLSGFRGLAADVMEAGREPLAPVDFVETASHRASVRAVAEGRADHAAIDCRSWVYGRRFEPAAAGLHVIGWTRRRIGLPWIASRLLDHGVIQSLRGVLRPRLDGAGLRRRLVSSGIAREDEIIGCSDAEIVALEVGHGRFPASYRSILSIVGRGAGQLVDRREFDFHHDRLARLNEDVRGSVAAAVSTGEPVAQPPANAFFISARHGQYQSCIAAGGGEDSPVWTYDEAMETLARTHDSVWDWMAGFVADAEYWVARGTRPAR